MTSTWLCTVMLKDDPLVPILQFAYEGPMKRASYIVGCAFDAYADSTGREYDYSVKPLIFAVSAAQAIDLVYGRK